MTTLELVSLSILLLFTDFNIAGKSDLRYTFSKTGQNRKNSEKNAKLTEQKSDVAHLHKKEAKRQQKKGVLLWINERALP